MDLDKGVLLLPFLDILEIHLAKSNTDQAERDAALFSDTNIVILDIGRYEM